MEEVEGKDRKVDWAVWTNGYWSQMSLTMIIGNSNTMLLGWGLGQHVSYKSPLAILLYILMKELLLNKVNHMRWGSATQSGLSQEDN